MTTGGFGGFGGLGSLGGSSPNPLEQIRKERERRLQQRLALLALQQSPQQQQQPLPIPTIPEPPPSFMKRFWRTVDPVRQVTSMIKPVPDIGIGSIVKPPVKKALDEYRYLLETLSGQAYEGSAGLEEATGIRLPGFSELARQVAFPWTRRDGEWARQPFMGERSPEQQQLRTEAAQRFRAGQARPLTYFAGIERTPEEQQFGENIRAARRETQAQRPTGERLWSEGILDPFNLVPFTPVARGIGKASRLISGMPEVATLTRSEQAMARAAARQITTGRKQVIPLRVSFIESAEAFTDTGGPALTDQILDDALLQGKPLVFDLPDTTRLAARARDIGPIRKMLIKTPIIRRMFSDALLEDNASPIANALLTHTALRAGFTPDATSAGMRLLKMYGNPVNQLQLNEKGISSLPALMNLPESERTYQNLFQYADWYRANYNMPDEVFAWYDKAKEQMDALITIAIEKGVLPDDILGRVPGAYWPNFWKWIGDFELYLTTNKPIDSVQISRVHDTALESAQRGYRGGNPEQDLEILTRSLYDGMVEKWFADAVRPYLPTVLDRISPKIKMDVIRQGRRLTQLKAFDRNFTTMSKRRRFRVTPEIKRGNMGWTTIKGMRTWTHDLVEGKWVSKYPVEAPFRSRAFALENYPEFVTILDDIASMTEAQIKLLGATGGKLPRTWEKLITDMRYGKYGILEDVSLTPRDFRSRTALFNALRRTLKPIIKKETAQYHNTRKAYNDAKKHAVRQDLGERQYTTGPFAGRIFTPTEQKHILQDAYPSVPLQNWKTIPEAIIRQFDAMYAPDSPPRTANTIWEKYVVPGFTGTTEMIAPLAAGARTTTAALDLGVGQIHGAPLLATRPVEHAKLTLATLENLRDPTIFARYLDNNRIATRDLISMNAMHGAGSDLIEAASTMSKILKRGEKLKLNQIPLVGRLARRGQPSATDITNEVIPIPKEWTPEQAAASALKFPQLESVLGRETINRYWFHQPPSRIGAQGGIEQLPPGIGGGIQAYLPKQSERGAIASFFKQGIQQRIIHMSAFPEQIPRSSADWRTYYIIDSTQLPLHNIAANPTSVIHPGDIPASAIVKRPDALGGWVPTRTGELRPLTPVTTPASTFFNFAEEQFNTWLLGAKIEFWNAYKPIALQSLAAGNNNAIEQLGNMVGKLTGTTDMSMLGLTPSAQRALSAWVAFSPRYNTAVLSLMTDIGRGDMRGDIARRAIGGMMAGGIFMYGAIAHKLDQPMHLDPTSGKLFTINVAGTQIGIGSMYVALARLASNIGEKLLTEPHKLVRFDERDHALRRFMESRLSVPTRLVHNSIMGSDYLGDPLMDEDTPTIINYMKILGDSTMPFWLQGMWETPRPGFQGVSAEFGGLRSWEVSLWERAEDLANIEAAKRYSHANGMPKKWDDLNKLEKATILEDRADIVDLMDRNTNIFGRRGGHVAQYRIALRDIRERVYEPELASIIGLYEQTRNGDQFRENLQELNSIMRSHRSIIEQDYPEAVEVLKEKAQEINTSDYIGDIAYNEYVLTVLAGDFDRIIDDDGMIRDFDYNAYAETRQEFREKWGEELWQYIQNRFSVNNPPLLQDYYQGRDAMGYYWTMGETILERTGNGHMIPDWRNYVNEPRDRQKEIEKTNRLFLHLRNAQKKARELKREQDPLLDAYLVKWMNYTPKHPINIARGIEDIRNNYLFIPTNTYGTPAE